MSKPSNWGKRLETLLKENNLSQKSAAKIAGVRPSVVNGWVSGVSPQDLEKIKKLSDHLNVSFTWLLTGESDIGHTPVVADLFEEVPYFDGIARIRIDRLISKK